MAWQESLIGAVCTLYQGVAINAKTKQCLVEKSDLPLLRIKDLKNNTVEQFIDPNNFPVNALVNESDIIYTRTGSLGLVFRGRKGVLHNNSFKVVPNHELSKDYLFHWLQNPIFKELIVGLSSKAAQPDITHAIFKKQRITFPSLPEQKRIVAILDQAFADIEQARAKTEQNLKNTRELFESYLQKVFSQRGEGWEEYSLAEVCNFKHGFAFKSEFFTQDKGYELLTPGNFFEEGGYRDRGSKQKHYDGPFPNEFLMSKGDLVVAMTEQAVGLLGSPALVPKDNTFLHNQRLGLVELKDEFKDNVSMEFLFHFFNTKYFRAKVQETATGLKVRHTSPKKMQLIAIWLPKHLDDQNSIAQELFNLKEESLKLEEVYKKKSLQLDELKKSILQKAFSGELTTTLEGDTNKGAVA